MLSRVLSASALAAVGVWIIAHVLYVEPPRDVPGVTWVAWAACASALIAALTMVAFAVVVERRTAAWLRFVRRSRAVGAVLGCGLLVVGLLRYQETEPRGEIQWLLFGLALLVAAGVAHLWLIREPR
jgi:hypothetical protein